MLGTMILQLPSLDPALALGLIVVGVLLTLGTLAAIVLPRMQPGKWGDLGPRMRSWWILCALLFAALIGGSTFFIPLFGLISFLALKEFLTLAPTRREDRMVVLLVYLSVPIAYGAVWFDNYQFFLTLIPVYLFLFVAFAMAWIGRTERFLATAGILYWGVVTCVTNLAYVPFLLQVPAEQTPQAGPAGLVFFLIFVTQLGDVAQYCWGKALGRTKITPAVSPNKTWEGAIGGWLTTGLVIWFLGPVFTPLTGLGLITAAVLLPVAGFAGDITMSAIKRDLGVKDTGQLLPGHGGVLDRLDSLTFTAPLFFHLLAFFAVARF